MTILRLLLLTFALLFILTRRIDVNVYKTKELTVKINFNILALVLRENKSKKNLFKRIRRSIKSARHAYQFLDYIISKSEVVLYEYKTSNNEYESSSALKIAYSYISKQIITSYLENTAKKFQISENVYQNQNIRNNVVLDLDIRFYLWHLIISALVLLYYMVKSSIKRLLKNV